MGDLVRVGISLPSSLAEAFDAYIEERSYPSRSEAVRDLIRDALIEKQWMGDTEEVVGTVTIVYDHHTRDLTDRLTRLQHDHLDVIISATHVHLNHGNCLEVIVLRGEAARVRSIGHQLAGARGVKHGNLTCTTTGAALP